MFRFDAHKWIPRFILADRNGKAMGKAIESAMNYMNEAIQGGVDCLLSVEDMPEWRLDELAWEYNLYYDLKYPVAQKRQIVANAFTDSRIYGTKKSILNTLASISPAGAEITISEWHSYSGDPYHFKVAIVGESGSDVPDAEDVEAIVNRIKNVRSYCDEVTSTTS